MPAAATEGDDGQAGRLLAGRYRVIEQLGRGGMGMVCRCMDEVLGREVAVKELRVFTDASGQELAELRLRMQREARAAARIRHHGVIAVHDVAQEGGRPIIVMELVDGPSLDDVLKDEGVLEPHEAAAIGAKVADALGAAHAVGVLHRDVKPGNVLLERGGRVVLTDFGIATMEDPGDGSASSLTQSGQLVGSLDFLAPERAQGQEPGPASDVWSLGALLYAAVEGGAPFRRTSTWSTLAAIVTEPLPQPRRAGPLGPVLHELMRKEAAARPDARRARQLLEAVAQGTSVADATHTAGATETMTLRSRAEQPRSESRSATSPPFTTHAPPAAERRDIGPELGWRPPIGPGSTPHQLPPPDAAAKGGSRGRRRLASIAAAVAVVLAAAGVTWAVVGQPISGGNSPHDVPQSQPQSQPVLSGNSLPSDSSPSSGTGSSIGAAAQGSGRSHNGSTPSGSGSSSSTGGAGSSTGGMSSSGLIGGSSGSSGNSGSSGSSGSKGSSSGSAGASAGGAPAPAPTSEAPVCQPIGGGKYNCYVWKETDSYNSSHQQVGILHAGTNYFYCQANLGIRETYGQWTNVWWAKTDDDSHNRNVYVSDVYIKGGANDAPVPGLPLC